MLAFTEVSNAALKKLSDDKKEEACFSSYFEAGLQELVDKMGQDTLTTVQKMAAMDRCCACLQTIVGKRDQAMVTKVRHPTAEKVTGPLFTHTRRLRANVKRPFSGASSRSGARRTCCRPDRRRPVRWCRRSRGAPREQQP